MFGAFPSGGPPQIGWWLTAIVVAVGVVGVIAIVIVAVVTEIRSGRTAERRPNLPGRLPKAA